MARRRRRWGWKRRWRQLPKPPRSSGPLARGRRSLTARRTGGGWQASAPATRDWRTTSCWSAAARCPPRRRRRRRRCHRLPRRRRSYPPPPLRPCRQHRPARGESAGSAPPVLRICARIAQGDCRALFANAQTARFTPADRARLAVVADSAEMLAEKLQVACKQMSNPAAQPFLEQHAIFCRTPGERRPRIAFVFPGQGSQYAGMLRELVRDVPAAGDALREIDAALVRHGLPSFAQMAWDDASRLGVDVWTTQAAMLVADHVLLAAITARGIRPDLVLGHSYGEFVALAASGACDFEQALRITRARCQSIDACPTAHGGMLATTLSPEAIQELASQAEVPIYLANHNAPDQTVIGGSREAVERFAALLRSRSYPAQVLAVPSPFHTPIMQGAAAAFAQALATAQFQRPRTPMLSVVTNDYVTEPDGIRANLVAHLTTPVRYVDLIRRIAAERETIFVEVGPQQALTRLHRRILESQDAMVIACDNPKRSGVEQLHHVQALLECSGALDAAAQPTAGPPISVAAAASVPPAAGEILHFDATSRRREKMRLAAASPPRTPRAPAATPRPTPSKPAAKPAPAARKGRRSHAASVRGDRTAAVESAGGSRSAGASGSGEVPDQFRRRADRLSAGGRRARCRPGSRPGNRQHQEGPIVRRAARVLRRDAVGGPDAWTTSPRCGTCSNFLARVRRSRASRPRWRIASACKWPRWLGRRSPRRRTPPWLPSPCGRPGRTAGQPPLPAGHAAELE